MCILIKQINKRILYLGSTGKGKETIRVLIVYEAKQRGKTEKERFRFLPLRNPLIFHDGLSLEEILDTRGVFYYFIQGPKIWEPISCQTIGYFI